MLGLEMFRSIDTSSDSDSCINFRRICIKEIVTIYDEDMLINKIIMITIGS
jgi:hypothetical protein